MPRGARIVDEYGIVKDCDYLYVAYNGKSEYVGEGYVSEEGLVRQFWPKTENPEEFESGIVLEEGTYDSIWIADNTGSAKAICYYIAQTGQVLLSERGGVEGEYEVINAINPAPRSQGVYLYKVDIVSGDVEANHPTGVWTDVNVDGTVGQLEYWVEQTASGSATGQLTMSFAEDDGAGSPIPSTIKTITVDFLAEVRSKRICMTTKPWNLNNVEVNEPAEVFILTIPENWWDPVNEYYVNKAYINGEFGFPKGAQESEVYACVWTPNVTVQVDQVSGDTVTSPDGLSLGVPYTTDQRRRWKIEATNPGDVVNAVVNVTVTDGLETVTKQITMRAEQVEEVSDPGEIDPTWMFTRSVYDQDIQPCGPIWKGGVARHAAIEIRFKPDGYMYVTCENEPDPDWSPEPWHENAGAMTDPENYEVYIFVNSWQLMPSSASSIPLWTQWKNLSSDAWYVAEINQAAMSCGKITENVTWKIGIQEVGRPSTRVYKNIKLSLYTEGTK